MADAALVRWLALQPKDLTHMLVLRRMRLWLECPCGECARLLGAALEAPGAVRVRQRLRKLVIERPTTDLVAARSASRAVCSAGRVILTWEKREEVADRAAAKVLDHALSAGCDPASLLDALCQEILPWLATYAGGNDSSET